MGPIGPFFIMAKYKTTVATSAVDLMSSDVDLGKNIVGVACYKQNYPITREITNRIVNGICNKMHRVYSYGRDTYTHGLPEGYAVIDGYDVGDLENIIEAELGYGINIQTDILDEPEPIFFARDYAQRKWGWSATTDRLMYPPVHSASSRPVYLHDADITDQGRLDITVRYWDGNKNSYYTISVPNLTLSQQDLYYQVRYTQDGVTGVDPRYWYYRLGDGTYPELEISDTSLESPYLPVVPLRENNRNLGPEFDEDGNVISRPTNDLYVTSKKLCKYADVVFDDLCWEVEKNPDVKDVDHAYLIWGVDIRDTKPAAKHYIFQFFEDLAIRDLPKRELRVRDSYYHIKISYSSCTVSNVAGTLSSATELSYSGETLTAKRRIDNSSYRKVVVTGLKHSNYVYTRHSVQTDLSESADEDNNNFILPLNEELSRRNKSKLEQENLYRQSYKMIFNSYERRKIKWYESSWFKTVLIAVAIVIAVFTGINAYAAISAAYTAGGVAAVAGYLAVMAIISLTLKTGFEILAEQLGPELAIATAVVLVVVGLTAESPGFEFQVEGMTVAADLLTLTTGIANGVTAYTDASLADLEKEIDEWVEYAQTELETLRELQEELEVDSFLDPMDFLYRPQIFLADETPEEFYNRTIHAGNIGVAALAQTESFVDTKLLLPEVKLPKEGTK